MDMSRGVGTGEFTLASFNAHWGVGVFGALAGKPYDVVEVIRGFDADIVVVPESWRPVGGESMLEPLRADGYTIETLRMAEMRKGSIPRKFHPGDGTWQLSVLSRFPLSNRRELPMGSSISDLASPRSALALDVDVHGTTFDLVALHTSSRLWYAGPMRHLRHVAPHLPRPERPAVVAGDFNFWGPGVVALLPGWKRAVRGRSWPAPRPHSQIDHVLVNDHVKVLRGEVLPQCHSDHRPVRATLAPLT